MKISTVRRPAVGCIEWLDVFALIAEGTLGTHEHGECDTSEERAETQADTAEGSDATSLEKIDRLSSGQRKKINESKSYDVMRPRCCASATVHRAIHAGKR